MASGHCQLSSHQLITTNGVFSAYQPSRKPTSSPQLPFKIILQPPNHPRRIPRHHRKRLHTLRDHTPRPHSHPPPNSNTRQNIRAPTYPTIIPNTDFLPELRTHDPLSYSWIHRMRRRIYRHTGADQNACPDGNSTRIQNREIRSDKRILSHGNVYPVVEANRSFDQGIAFKQGVVFLLGSC